MGDLTNACCMHASTGEPSDQLLDRSFSQNQARHVRVEGGHVRTDALENGDVVMYIGGAGGVNTTALSYRCLGRGSFRGLGNAACDPVAGAGRGWDKSP
jgi:hypothetical protein